MIATAIIMSMVMHSVNGREINITGFAGDHISSFSGCSIGGPVFKLLVLYETMYDPGKNEQD